MKDLNLDYQTANKLTEVIIGVFEGERMYTVEATLTNIIATLAYNQNMTFDELIKDITFIKENHKMEEL